MMKYISKFLATILAFSMLMVPVKASEISTQVEQTSAGLSALGGKPGKLLGEGKAFPAGTSVCDWVAMALALTGSEENYSAYRDDLQNYVEEAYEKNGGLERVKSTTYHRVILVVLALGGDPTHFGAKPDGTAIDLVADGTYAFAGDSLGAQGLNGWIYGLLALDASGVEVPGNAKFTRENMLRAIVDAQEPDGGFGLTAGKSDVDITAMALQALAPYEDDYPHTIENALNYLAETMDDSCHYSSYGAKNVESSAQVILALCALGIDPVEDNRFCRGERNILTGLENFRQPDNTFAHTPEETEGNFLATAQTLLAQSALQKLRDGEGWIYDFTDYSGPNQKSENGSYLLAAAVVVSGIVCILFVGKRRKNGKNNG